MRFLVVISSGTPGIVDVGNGFSLGGHATEDSLCPQNVLCVWEGSLTVSGTVRHVGGEEWHFDDGSHTQENTIVFATRNGAKIWMRKIGLRAKKGIGAVIYTGETTHSAKERSCIVCGKKATATCSCCDRCYAYCDSRCATKNWDQTIGRHAEIEHARTITLPRRTTTLPLLFVI